MNHQGSDMIKIVYLELNYDLTSLFAPKNSAPPVATYMIFEESLATSCFWTWRDGLPTQN